MKLEDLIIPGILVVGAYFVIKNLPSLFGSSIVGAASSVVPGISSSSPLATVGGVPGAALGLAGGGVVGAVVGGEIGQALAPTTPQQVQGFTVGGILGGIAGPVGMVIGTQIGKALSPTPSTNIIAPRTVRRTSERDVIPVSAINPNVPKKVAAKIKAGKVF